jgi:hypothetical protein
MGRVRVPRTDIEISVLCLGVAEIELKCDAGLLIFTECDSRRILKPPFLMTF